MRSFSSPSQPVPLALVPSPTDKQLHVVPVEADNKPYAWIVSPAIDLLFCCGGLVWILFAINYYLIGPAGKGPAMQALALIAVLGTHALSEPHIAATLARVYRTEETRTRFRRYTYWAALFCGAMALAGMFIGGVTPILAKIYLIWVTQHFTAQTYGLTLLYCFKRNYVLRGYEKRVLWTLLNCTWLFAVLRQFTYKEWNANGFLAQQIPFWGPLPPVILQCCGAALALSALALLLLVAKKALLEKRLMPLPAIFMTVTGVLIFLLPRQATGVLWLYVPAFYHGSQYLVLSTAFYLKERGLPENTPPSKIASLFLQSAGLRYMGFLILSSLVIYVALPHLLEELGFNYSLAFATIFCAFNIHHFLTDQAIWKLRDAKVRDILVA